jgi:cell division protein FtsB
LNQQRKTFFFWQIYLQKQAMLVRQLEEELRLRMRAPNIEMQQQIEALYAENEHLTREIAILRDTIKVNRNLLKSN